MALMAVGAVNMVPTMLEIILQNVLASGFYGFSFKIMVVFRFNNGP
jgi:hypothetical protein